MSVISAIRDFIAAECPYLDEFSEVFSGVSKVEVDTLDENPKNYMIEVAPADPVVRTYTNGIRSAGWRSTSAAGCSSGQQTILILRIFMSISLSGWRSVPEKGTFQNWRVPKSHDTSGQRPTVT